MQTAQYLEKLSAGMNKGESELIALAIDLGLQKLWQDFVLGQYVRQEISKNEAIEQVGSDLVALAEQRLDSVQLDNTDWQRQWIDLSREVEKSWKTNKSAVELLGEMRR